MSALPDLSTLTLPELRALDLAVRGAIAAAAGIGGPSGRCRGGVGHLHRFAATQPLRGQAMAERLSKSDLIDHIRAHGLTREAASAIVEATLPSSRTRHGRAGG